MIKVESLKEKLFFDTKKEVFDYFNDILEFEKQDYFEYKHCIKIDGEKIETMEDWENWVSIYSSNNAFLLDYMFHEDYTLVEMDDQIQDFLGEGCGSIFEKMMKEIPYGNNGENELDYDPLKESREALDKGEYIYLVWDNKENTTRNVKVKFEVLENSENIFTTKVRLTRVKCF